MAEKFSRWDSADYLKTDEDMALYFEICTADDPGDGSLIRSALGAKSPRTRHDTKARDTGISRDGLTTALSSEVNPRKATRGRQPGLCHDIEGDAGAGPDPNKAGPGKAGPACSAAADAKSHA